MITIVDYGIGNLGSLKNMLRYIGFNVSISSDINVIKKASKLVLPGVGAFDAAMQRINKIEGLRETLDYKALSERIPILGVCLGMQLLTLSSEEGQLPGLAWIDATTRRFPNNNAIRIPHMGWNTTIMTGSDNNNKILNDLEKDARFYFAHSYYVSTSKPENSLLRTTYGVQFDSAIVNENIFGFQFHPEKSHHFGIALLRNFGNL